MLRPAKAFSWTRPHWEGVVAIVLLALSAGVFVKLALDIDRPIVDDALISIGYARSLADGEGLRITPYSQIAEGYSNPTWTLVLAIFEKMHVNSMRPAKTLGMIFVALSLPLVFLWGPVSQRRKVHLEDALGPLLACSNATLAYWSLGGLETGILVFLIALFVLLLYAQRSKKIAFFLGLAAAALTLTRPEGALYLAALALPSLVDWAITTRLTPRRADWLALASFVVPLVLFVAVRRVYFGAWLPNTYYAKQSWYIGLANPKVATEIYVRSFATAVRPLCIACAAGVGLSLMGGLNTAKAAFSSALVALSVFFFAWYANADWMKEYRFLAPSVLFLAYPASAGVSSLRKVFGRAFVRRRFYLRVLVHAAVAASAIAAVWSTSKTHHDRWTEVKAAGGDAPRNPADRYEYGSDLRAMVEKLQMTHPFIGAPDMGYVAVGLREFEIVDLAGLTDASIARHYGNQAAMRDFLLNEGLPTILLVWGPSNYLWSMPDILGQYHAPQYASYKVYAKVSAEKDDRCPSGKATAQKDTPGQMIQNIVTDLKAGEAVRALAHWRCYFTYRKDTELPTESERIEIARTAESIGDAALGDRKGEPALRAYSLCAVIGASSWAPSTSCRMRAEKLRARLFPRPVPATSKRGT